MHVVSGTRRRGGTLDIGRLGNAADQRPRRGQPARHDLSGRNGSTSSRDHAPRQGLLRLARTGFWARECLWEDLGSLLRIAAELVYGLVEHPDVEDLKSGLARKPLERDFDAPLEAFKEYVE